MENLLAESIKLILLLHAVRFSVVLMLPPYMRPQKLSTTYPEPICAAARAASFVVSGSDVDVSIGRWLMLS